MYLVIGIGYVVWRDGSLVAPQLTVQSLHDSPALLALFGSSLLMAVATSLVTRLDSWSVHVLVVAKVVGSL